MKGMLFLSFLDLVESQYGQETLEAILQEVAPDNGGVYTSAGDYDHTELVALVMALSNQSDVSISNLTKSFGMYHFAEFIAAYPQLFKGLNSSFALLEKVDGFIHEEVKKLYPGARPPKFDFKAIDDNTVELIYQSPRCLGDVAEGLIQGCAAYYGEKIVVKRERLGAKSGSMERFVITR
jgi:hypothetical protein|tara:strand:+ start:204 stop:743 length:540 start_codon:yes stop_codon:yes gene_type:complete